MAVAGGGLPLGSSGADGLLEELEADGLAEAEAVLQLMEGAAAVLEGGYLQVRVGGSPCEGTGKDL